MFPDNIPDSLLRLAELSRPDRVDANSAEGMVEQVAGSESLVQDWANDARFWQTVCRDDLLSNVGQILPHVTNGQFDLAALVQSRISVPPDPARRAWKAVEEMPMVLSECGRELQSYTGMDQASISIRVLELIFTTAAGGLLMSANLVTEGYPMSTHAGIIDAGAKSILVASRDLKALVGQFTQVIY